MVRKITERLYKVNTYASCHLLEVTDDYDEEVKEIIKSIMPGCIGYKLNLFVWLANATIQGYGILSVTEFNLDGSKPKVAYATEKDFKKILKYLKEK